MLVDCVRVSEFDHGFVYVFACLDAKKMKWKRRKFWISYFLGNHVLGEEHEEQLFLTKIFNIFILKLLTTKILF